MLSAYLGGLRQPLLLSRTGALCSLAAVVALAVLLARTDWRAMVEPLATIAPAPFLAAIALALGVEVVKTVRWQLLLGAPLTALPRLLGVVFTGRLLNVLAPLRAGDVWRVAAAAYGEQRPLVAAGGSVLVEKVLDGAGLAAISVFLLWDRSSASLVALVLGLGLVVALAALPLVERRLGRQTLLRHGAAALAYLRNWRLLARVVALTGAGLALGTLVNLTVLRALDLPSSVQWGLVMLVAGYAAGLIPSGPAQLGVFELAVATPLSAAGLDYPVAVTAALALHLVLLLMLAVGGLVGLLLAAWSATRRPTAGAGAPPDEAR
jgi:uncharacterized membrane protein YbhN (UPF0104 family)